MNQNYKNCIIDNKENDKFDLGVNGFTDIWNPFVTLLLIATIIVTISSLTKLIIILSLTQC